MLTGLWDILEHTFLHVVIYSTSVQNIYCENFRPSYFNALAPLGPQTYPCEEYNHFANKPDSQRCRAIEALEARAPLPPRRCGDSG